MTEQTLRGEELVRDLHRHAFDDCGGEPPVTHIAVQAATRIEQLRKALETTTDICDRYAHFITHCVCADDLEMHPYPPSIEDAVENARAALNPSGER